MDNNKKNILMQYLYRFVQHYDINNTPPASFKKREELLVQLKQKNSAAWSVMHTLFEASIKAERINNDKEKFDKARLLWDAEHAAAEHHKVDAEMQLVEFCKQNGIPVGGIAVES